MEKAHVVVLSWCLSKSLDHAPVLCPFIQSIPRAHFILLRSPRDPHPSASATCPLSFNMSDSHDPASGPLHGLFPLPGPGIPLPDLCRAASLTSRLSSNVPPT